MDETLNVSSPCFLDVSESEQKAHTVYFDKIFKSPNPMKAWSAIVQEMMELPEHNSESYLFKCGTDDILFATKVYFYTIPPTSHKDGAIGEAPANEEIEIMQLLRDEVIDKRLIVPCVARMWYSYDMKMTVAAKMLTNEKEGRISCKILVDEQLARIRHRLAYDKLSFSVMEMYGEAFFDFATANLHTAVGFEVVKSFVFMIIHTLSVLQEVFPGFSHGDLHLANILIQHYTDYFEYRIDHPSYILIDNTYYVPFFGMLPKIIDFNFGAIPTRNVASIHRDTITFKMRITDDIVTFLSRLSLVMPNFIEQLGPYNKYYGLYVNDAPSIAQLPTARQLLENSVFSQYKDKPATGFIISSYGKSSQNNTE